MTYTQAKLEVFRQLPLPKPGMRVMFSGGWFVVRAVQPSRRVIFVFRPEWSSKPEDDWQFGWSFADWWSDMRTGKLRYELPAGQA